MGTSGDRGPHYISVGDHPHAYGDKVLHGRTGIKCVGSSPRVWGQEQAQRLSIFFKGIIPTRMGTSYRTEDRQAAHKDHPHAYGDKKALNHSSYGSLGSSPRVWGQEHARYKSCA